MASICVEGQSSPSSLQLSVLVFLKTSMDFQYSFSPTISASTHCLFEMLSNSVSLLWYLWGISGDIINGWGKAERKILKNKLSYFHVPQTPTVYSSKVWYVLYSLPRLSERECLHTASMMEGGKMSLDTLVHCYIKYMLVTVNPVNIQILNPVKPHH